MKKYKENFKNVLEILLLIGVIYLISTDRFPYLQKTLVVLWLGALVFRILEDIAFRVGLKKNEIRYPTINDTAQKYSNLAFGIMVLAISVGCLLWIPSSQDVASIGIIVGILIVVAFFLYLPKGTMKLRTDKLLLSGISEIIDKDSIEQIIIEDSTITFNSSGKVLSQNMLKLDPIAALEIEQFLIVSIGKNELIKNNVR